MPEQSKGIKEKQTIADCKGELSLLAQQTYTVKGWVTKNH